MTDKDMEEVEEDMDVEVATSSRNRRFLSLPPSLSLISHLNPMITYAETQVRPRAG